jgi:hypothetical protein
MAVKHILHVQAKSLKNKIGTDLHADSPCVRFSSGLPRDRAAGVSSAVLAAAARPLASRQCRTPPSDRPGALSAAVAANAGQPAVQEQLSVATEAGAAPRAANELQGAGAVGHAGAGHARHLRCSSTGIDAGVGSSVLRPMVSGKVPSSTSAQKISPPDHTAESDGCGPRPIRDKMLSQS